MGFESYLADCRAYEMVTPPFKDGGASLEVEALSASGTRALTTSIGGYAGVEANPIGAYYEANRTASGWSTSAVSPSISAFPAQQFLAVSSDLTRTLWALRTPLNSIYTENLYMREPNGVFVEVGPAIPPEASEGPPAGGWEFFEEPGKIVNRGASSDLSHVFFQVKSDRAPWPGDTTIHNTHSQSLYEYVGTGNRTPILVGAESDGRLVSSCGTVIGSIRGREKYDADTYNAASQDGEVVFFTAQGQEGCEEEGAEAPEVNEVFAHIGRSPGEIVAISQPSPVNCAECQTGETKVSAEFQGASSDGSKTFFLSAQEVFPGDTGKNLYEYDFDNPAGKKLLQVSSGLEAAEVQGVARVSEDGSHVYFVARGALTGANSLGAEPVKGGENLYVFERDASYPAGRLTFVATLSEADEQDWSAIDQRPVQATPNGEFLVFDSSADLTPNDTSTEQQVFEYDALNGELVRVSVGEAGYMAGVESASLHSSSVAEQTFAFILHPAAATTSLAISEDGSVVMFASAGALTRGATDAAGAGAASVYEYRSSGTLADGGVYLVSDGSNTVSATPTGIDPSGNDAFFGTVDSLVAPDGDKQFDLYDARTDGGFSLPQAPFNCLALGSCQGDVSPSLTFGVAGSVAEPAGNNVQKTTPPPLRVKPTRAQLLSKALRVCSRKPRRKRAGCDAKARKRYGVVIKTKRKDKG